VAGLVVACSSPAPVGSTTKPQGLIDSHVHLSYYAVGEQLAAHGFVAAVDLGAPCIVHDAPLTLIQSGPMITSPGGYPLDSWGAGEEGVGYGIGCADAECVERAIDRLAAEGARVVKLPLDPGGLAPELVAPAVARAHAKGCKVVVHALTNDAAMRAAAAGGDVLAHTPVEPLAPATVEAWRGRAVISTLAAFGGSPAAIANLRELREADVTILYGTDLGNLRVDGVSQEEVSLLRQAGLDDEAVTASMTSAPSRYWQLAR